MTARSRIRQPAGRPTPLTVSVYISAAPAAARPALRAIRAAIRKAAPKAAERISYRMPAYFQDGVLVYFAAFKQHVGLYPPVREAALLSLVAKYAGPKGNLKFPLSEPMPLGLIGRIVRARVKARR